MNKKIFSILMVLIMVVCLLAGLSMTASATDDDWLPTITFDPNGGTGEMKSHSQGGETYPLPECEFTAPEGYRFKCWKVTGYGEMAPGERVYMGGNLEAKAIWEPIPAKLTFDANGGTGELADVEQFGDYTLPECPFTAPEGQQFKSWQFGDQEKQPGESIYIDDILTVSANWEPIPTEPPTEPSTEPLVVAPTPPAEPAPTEPDLPATGNRHQGMPWWGIALLAVAAVVVVALVIALVVTKKKK